MASDFVTPSVEQCCVIKFPVKEEVKLAEILHRLIAQYGEDLSFASIYDWYIKFSEGPKNSKMQLPAGKVTANVVWDSEGVIHVDFLCGATINAQYYSNLLYSDVHQAIRKQIHGKLSKKIIPLHEHVRPHAENLTKATLAAMGWSIMNHPTYSPGCLFVCTNEGAPRRTEISNR
jgi:hypothetical protein